MHFGRNTLAKVSFGEWLKRRRKAEGLTQEQLAQQASCSTINLRKIEAEDRRPSGQIVERLAEIFNIPQNEQASFLRFARGDWKAAPSLESEDAPWRVSTTSPRFNLPASLTSLIGREDEIKALREYLSNPAIRLITLTGPPGIGKTSLSLEVARESMSDFADGVFFVPLAPLEDLSLLLPTVIQSLGFVETGRKSSMQLLKDGVADKHMLLVLDNLEHIIEAVAPIVAGLLASCSHLKILTTSREALRVPGEWLYPVPILNVPSPNEVQSLQKEEGISEFTALTLFAERARAARPDFAINADNIQAVAFICAQLDGLPLAIELIAARIRWMTPKALSERMSDEFTLYADGMRAVSVRQKTLHNAIRWSYGLLSDAEQKLFARLSVFVGGFTLDAAESIFARTMMEKSISELTVALSDKSLLQRTFDHKAQSEARFGMLVTIQMFARDQLKSTGEESEVRNWHLAYFLDLAEAGDPHMSGHGLLEWLPRLQADMDNFRAALEWSFASQTNTEKSLRLVNALFPFWRVRSDFHEAQLWLDRALNLPGAERYSTAYAKALLGLGLLKLISGYDPQAAEPLLAQSVRLTRESGDSLILAEALDFLGLAHAFQRKFDQAHPLLEESQLLFRTKNYRKGLALTNWHLGWLADAEGHQTAALQFSKQALTLFQEVGDILRQSILLRTMGSLLFEAGEWKQGSAMLRQALSKAYQLGSKLEMGHAFLDLSLAEGRQSRFKRAAQFLWTAQNLYIICGAQGHILDLEKELGQLRTHLDPPQLDAVLEEAQSWTLDEAIQYALEDSSS